MSDEVERIEQFGRSVMRGEGLTPTSSLIRVTDMSEEELLEFICQATNRSDVASVERVGDFVRVIYVAKR